MRRHQETDDIGVSENKTNRRWWGKLQTQRGRSRRFSRLRPVRWLTMLYSSERSVLGVLRRSYRFDGTTSICCARSIAIKDEHRKFKIPRLAGWLDGWTDNFTKKNVKETKARGSNRKYD